MGKTGAGKGRKSTFHYDMEIDFHGYYPEDAIRELEELIYANESSSFMIIHGRGDGVLKKALRDFLRSNRYVRELHFGEDINIPGGDGVTVVYT